MTIQFNIIFSPIDLCFYDSFFTFGILQNRHVYLFCTGCLICLLCISRFDLFLFEINLIEINGCHLFISFEKPPYHIILNTLHVYLADDIFKWIIFQNEAKLRMQRKLFKALRPFSTDDVNMYFSF